MKNKSKYKVSYYEWCRMRRLFGFKEEFSEEEMKEARRIIKKEQEDYIGQGMYKEYKASLI